MLSELPTEPFTQKKLSNKFKETREILAHRGKCEMVLNRMVDQEHRIDNANGYRVIRDLRWPKAVQRPQSDSTDICKRGIHTAVVIAGMEP